MLRRNVELGIRIAFHKKMLSNFSFHSPARSATDDERRSKNPSKSLNYFFCFQINLIKTNHDQVQSRITENVKAWTRW